MGMRASASVAEADASSEVNLDPQLDVAPVQPTWPKISLRSRAEEEIVKDARRKKAVLQLCKDDSLSGRQTGYSLSRLKGTLRKTSCHTYSTFSTLLFLRPIPSRANVFVPPRVLTDK